MRSYIYTGGAGCGAEVLSDKEEKGIAGLWPAMFVRCCASAFGMGLLEAI